MNKGIMLNIDDTHYWHSRHKIGAHPDEEALRAYIRQYRNTQVTDLILCAAGRIACYPSKVTDSHLDKYHQTHENGYDVSYKDTLLSVVHELYEEKNIDVYAVWLDEARRCGLKPWLSVRMNDCHDCLLPTSRLHSRFYHEHPELRRIRHRTADGYFDNCFDYEQPAVRAHMLTLIGEILDRYAPDGLELDWQREAFCFRPGHEDPSVITEFMWAVKALVKAAEDRSGHAIPVCVRVPADPEDALELGFDVAAWADERLVQAVCPTARWATTDNDMPIGLWKRLLRGTSVSLAPGIELLIRARPDGPILRTDEHHVTAAAAQYFSFGADRIYLYNYFDDPDPENAPYWIPAEGQTAMAVRAEGMARLLNLIGDPEKVMAAERCHMMTYRDLRPMWRSPDRPLPLTVKDGKPAAMLRIVAGHASSAHRAFVRLGLQKDTPAGLEVYVNSRPVLFVKTEACRPAYTDLPLFVYELPDGLSEDAAVIELIARGGDVTVGYADVLLLPAE